jgi:hypothetical protein
MYSLVHAFDYYIETQNQYLFVFTEFPQDSPVFKLSAWKTEAISQPTEIDLIYFPVNSCNYSLVQGFYFDFSYNYQFILIINDLAYFFTFDQSSSSWSDIEEGISYDLNATPIAMNNYAFSENDTAIVLFQNNPDDQLMTYLFTTQTNQTQILGAQKYADSTVINYNTSMTNSISNDMAISYGLSQSCFQNCAICNTISECLLCREDYYFNGSVCISDLDILLAEYQSTNQNIPEFVAYLSNVSLMYFQSLDQKYFPYIQNLTAFVVMIFVASTLNLWLAYCISKRVKKILKNYKNDVEEIQPLSQETKKKNVIDNAQTIHTEGNLTPEN